MSAAGAPVQSALESLYAPWEEPNSHRVKADKAGDSARIVKGRRPSKIVIAQNIRAAVREWRENGFYAGASGTTRALLHHWFFRDHPADPSSGREDVFRYVRSLRGQGKVATRSAQKAFARRAEVSALSVFTL